MSNEIVKEEKKSVSKKASELNLQQLISHERTKQRFEEVIGKKAPKFLTSVLNIAKNNKLLAKAKPVSLVNSALIAATLDLPIDQNLGFAYIVPYKDEAQFQMGYKGFIQLAQRSGQFLRINVSRLYEGQFISYDPITDELVYDLSNKKKDKVTHYIAYFKLKNGFEKFLVMSIEEVKAHAKKYSKSINSKSGVWSTNFDAMAEKTVLKLLLSRFAPLSTEMQTAIVTDQAVIKNVSEDNIDVRYIDNEPEEAEEIEDAREITDDEIDAVIAEMENSKDEIDIDAELEKEIFNE